MCDKCLICKCYIYKGHKYCHKCEEIVDRLLFSKFEKWHAIWKEELRPILNSEDNGKIFYLDNYRNKK